MSLVNFVRLPIAALCATFLVIFGFSHFNARKKFVDTKQQSVRPLEAKTPSPAAPVAPVAASMSQTTNTNEEKFRADPTTAIAAFRQWAETAAVSGLADADLNKGMELAKARANGMKALIQQDPASALRQALPKDLRASLPPALAAVIEQPVKTSGLCSIRMMCNHSPDSPHSGCQETPILLQDVDSWNAYYGAQQWQSYLGQTVSFEGLAVDEELAVQAITPSPHKENQ